MGKVREVWKDNVEQELELISRVATSRYNAYASFDTEFPGFLHRTPFRATEEQRYGDMKRNVDATKLVQLGLTFFNEQGESLGCSWQINFQDFDLAIDAHSVDSIELLKKSGHDFDKNQRDGVKTGPFFESLRKKLIRPCKGKIKWITFHGMYDLGYMVKMLTGYALPDTLPQFLYLLNYHLGDVYDVKHMARSFYGLGEGMGLVKMAEELNAVDSKEAEGQKHQAGFDSMLTGLVFWKLIKDTLSVNELKEFAGVLFGLERHCSSNYDDRRVLMAGRAADNAKCLYPGHLIRGCRYPIVRPKSAARPPLICVRSTTTYVVTYVPVPIYGTRIGH